VSDGHGGTVNQTFIAPFWGQVKPFALKSVTQYALKTPAVAGSAAYQAQVDQILAYSANLTDRQKVIAEYWADGPSSELPPGHWNLFGQFVSNRDHHSLDTDAKMFFAINNALLGASVWTWGVKRLYDYVRPVTAVHWQYAGSNVTAWAGAGMGTQSIPAANWRPYQAITVVTPPFSEYVSGHSTFSAAAARVLKLFTGSDSFNHSVTIASGNSRVEPGLVPAAAVTLSWPTFSAAADEAGISRRYGGIHFIDGDLEGRRVGKKIGTAAFARSQRYFGDDDSTVGDDD
jgi:membrane-associated phospholipid phosphatase